MFDWLYLLDTNGGIQNGQPEPGKQVKRAQNKALDATQKKSEKGRCRQGKPSHQLKVEEGLYRKKDGAKHLTLILVPQPAAEALIDGRREGKMQSENRCLITLSVFYVFGYLLYI